MKNEFQQLVDRRLSGLQWDERRARRVLAALESEGGTIMKRKLTLSIALVTVIVLMASVALAAVTLIYSPSASALNQARNALIEQYGLTHTTLGLFTHSLSMDGDTITFTFADDLMASYGGNAGDYTVTLRDGEVIASWTHDEADPALWQSGDLDAPIWGQPQLEAILRERTLAGTAIGESDCDDSGVTYEFASSTPAPAPAETPELVPIEIAPVTPAPGELTEAEALAIVRAALMETFGLTEDDIANTDFFRCELMQVGDYPLRHWSVNAWCQKDGFDWNMYVEIDASTGEITAIVMQTGGNG